MCRFLNLCEQYGLLSKDVKTAARLDGQALDQNTKRVQKVQRFKREREIKATMANVQMKRMRIAQLNEEVIAIPCVSQFQLCPSRRPCILVQLHNACLQASAPGSKFHHAVACVPCCAYECSEHMSSMPAAVFHIVVQVCIYIAKQATMRLQDGIAGEQDEDSEREVSLLQIELETMKAVEQTQMLQQVCSWQCHVKVCGNETRTRTDLPACFRLLAHFSHIACTIR